MQRRAWGSGRGCSIIQVRDDSACLPGPGLAVLLGGWGRGLGLVGGKQLD